MTGVDALDLDVAEMLPDPVLIMGSDGTVRWGNLAASEMFGGSLEDWHGRNALHLLHPDDLASILMAFESVHHKRVGSAIEARIMTASGEYRVFEARGRSLATTHGSDDVILVFRDLTDRRRWELAHGDVQVFQTLLQYSPTITLLLDESGVIRSGGGAVPRQLGFDQAEIEGHRLDWLADPAQAPDVARRVAAAAARPGPTSFETLLRHRDGRSIPYEVTVVNLLDDPVVDGLVVTAHDITDLYDARQELVHRVNHDSLTGLPNRTLFTDRLTHAAALCRRRGSQLAVFFCDLDGFKKVNDTHGHAAGDDLLRAVAGRMVLAARSADTVARLGGDEFVVLAEDVDQLSGEEIAGRIVGAFNEPFAFGEAGHAGQVELSVSVGWAVSDGSDEEGVVSLADARMYEAKRAGRHVVGPENTAAPASEDAGAG